MLIFSFMSLNVPCENASGVVSLWSRVGGGSASLKPRFYPDAEASLRARKCGVRKPSSTATVMISLRESLPPWVSASHFSIELTITGTGL